MSKYNFDELTCRRGSSSLKWDTMTGDDVIPLWVADMDFRTAPAITEAVQRRASSGIFGYVSVPDRYYDALVNWFGRRHGWKIDRDRVIYTSGVVPAISAIIKALTVPGDGVIVQTPAYNGFFSSIRNNGCRNIDNPLIRCEQEKGFTYRIDFPLLEKQAADPRNKVLILCNPHNPTGRVWHLAELQCIKEICRKYDVYVISDEIHCELTHGRYRYIPYGTIDERAIVCCSPSKAFNTAGLQIANIVCPDEKVQYRIDRAINDNEVCDVNPFGVEGLIAAYNEGEEWLDALRHYLDDNYQRLRTVIAESLPDWNVCNSESTYLAWIDVSATGMSGDEMERYLLEKAGVRVSSGSIYGSPEYIRVNYACPRPRLDEALARIKSINIDN